MRIALDCREALSDRPTGKGIWAKHFIEELLTREHRLHFLSDRSVPEAWTDAGHTQTVIARSGLLWHLSAAKKVRSIQADVYVSPTSYIVPALVGSGVSTVPIVHDLIAWQPGKHDRKATIIERLLLGRVCRTASHICTVSRATKDDLLKRYPQPDPKQITPIFAGPSGPDVVNDPDGTTILCIGTLCPRKNQLQLIRAFKKLPADLQSHYRLILVGGRGWNDRKIVDEATKAEGIEWVGYASQDEIESLLSSCTVFALPSLYEGFGLPVLDALQRGIPVLTSDRGSLKEVAGEAAVFCDPESVESIAAGLKSLLSDHSKRSILSQKGPAQAKLYSWKRTVDGFLSVIEG